MIKGTKDGTVDLRWAIKTAFPQMTEPEITNEVARMRAKNRKHGGS